MHRILIVVLLVSAFSKVTGQNFPTLTFQGANIIPHNYTCDTCDDLPIGGLSGIAYDEATNQYYFVADKPPSRYYKVKLDTTENLIQSYDGVTLLEPSEAELESIRFQPGTQTLFKANEHARSTMIWAGEDRLHVPSRYKLMQYNAGFEGMTFSREDQTVYVALERPLKTEERCSKTEAIAGITRFLAIDLTQPAATPKEYAYPIHNLDSIAPNGNGVTEIVWWKDQQLLVLERTYFRSLNKNSIRIYGVDLSTATNVHERSVCALPADAQVLKPTLLFDFAWPIEAGELERVDNVEGMILSPDRKHLFLVSDNNFRKSQQTQVLWLRVGE